MKLSTVIVAVALAGSCGAAVAADAQPATPPTAPVTTAPPTAQRPAEPAKTAEVKKDEPLGSRLFDQYCLACHSKTDPTKTSDKTLAAQASSDQTKKPDAPSMPIMSSLYRQRAGSDKVKYVQSLIGFLKAPAIDRALDQNAVKEFGLMKPLAEKYPQVTDAELAAVAEWMWEYYAPTMATAATTTTSQGRQQANIPQGMQAQGSMGLTTGLPAADSPIAKAEGASLFKKFCNDCHPKSDAPEAGDQPQVSPDQMKIQAPPMSMMSAHYRQVTGGDKNKYITRMLDFVRHPSADKSVDPRSIEHFGLKKPVTEKHPDVTDAEIAAIAEWLWDYYKDVWIIRLPAHGVWSD